MKPLACTLVLLVLSNVALHAQSAEEDPTFNPWNGMAILIPEVPLKGRADARPVPVAYDNLQITRTSEPQTECMIAVNPADSTNIIATAIDYSKYGYPSTFVTRDAGATWNRSTVASLSPGTGGDPWLAFDADGTAYYSSLNGASGSRYVTVLQSSNGGATWRDFASFFTTVQADEPVLSVDLVSGSPYRNTIYAASVKSTSPFPSGIVLQYRRKDSVANSPLIAVTSQSVCQIPDIAIGLNGSVYVSYISVKDIVNIAGGLYFNKSSDGGATFGEDMLIRQTRYTDTVKGFPRVGFPSASRIGPTPRIVVDTSAGPRRGWLFVSYSVPRDQTNGTDLDVFLQRSTNDGQTWSEPVRVNDDPVEPLHDQLTPALCISPDGAIGIAFYDRRDDPDNEMVNLYMAISTDGGETFENTRVSSAATDPLPGYRMTGLSLADYIGIGATHSAFYPVWTDGRTNDGSLNTYTARVPIPVRETAMPPSDEGRSWSLAVRGSSIVLSEAAGPIRVSLIDVLGRTAFSSDIEATDRTEVGLPRVAPGVYFVVASNARTMKTARWIEDR